MHASLLSYCHPPLIEQVQSCYKLYRRVFITEAGLNMLMILNFIHLENRNTKSCMNLLLLAYRYFNLIPLVYKSSDVICLKSIG